MPGYANGVTHPSLDVVQDLYGVHRPCAWPKATSRGGIHAVPEPTQRASGSRRALTEEAAALTERCTATAREPASDADEAVSTPEPADGARLVRARVACETTGF